VDEALAAALSQDVGTLEVRVYDDGSDDGTYEKLEAGVAAYRGPHAVVLSPDRSHRGLAFQLGRAAREASGELVVVAAGDDVSRPDRVRRLLEAFEPGVSALHSNATVIDARGVAHGPWMPVPPAPPASWRDVLDGRWQLFGAAAAYERSLLLAHGGLRADVVVGGRQLYAGATRALRPHQIRWVAP
jgi:glycosyltransferase involved in cell wall biosynthesis